MSEWIDPAKLEYRPEGEDEWRPLLGATLGPGTYELREKRT